MLAMGYRQRDHTLVIKHSNSEGVTTLLVYTNDINVTSNDEKEKKMLKQYLAREFEIKELEKLKYLIKIEVPYSKAEIFISKQRYGTALLTEIEKLIYKSIGTQN